MQDTKRPVSKVRSRVLSVAGVGILVVAAFLAGRYSVEVKKSEEKESTMVRPEKRQPQLEKEALLQSMVLIPEGEFIMGTDEAKEKPLPASYGFAKPPYSDEQPIRTISLKAFYIDRFEVTNAEYKEFVDATQNRKPDHWKSLDLTEWARYPVVNVSWFEADEYCKWRGKQLPTEEEWEKAARGTDGRRFPWGDEYDEKKANNQQKGLAPVGFFTEDVSPYGVHDMGANVSEWVDSWYKPYPGNEEEDPDFGEKYRVLRGGSWGGTGHYNLSYYIRAADRSYANPARGYEDAGFRCALSAE